MIVDSMVAVMTKVVVFYLIVIFALTDLPFHCGFKNPYGKRKAAVSIKNKKRIGELKCISIAFKHIESIWREKKKRADLDNG